MTIGNLQGSERTLVVIALQALHRERATAYSSVCTACDLTGKRSPEAALFGLDEVIDALRRVGAMSVTSRRQGEML